MFCEKSIAVVVPAYDEETQISKVISTIPDYIDYIVIVDDCSSDRTVDVVLKNHEDDKRIILIRHQLNEGVGGAIATGYKWARDNRIDIAVVMAGDGQMDPRDLPLIIKPVAMGIADYSKGNRLFTGEAFKTIPKIRYFGNAVLSLLTKIASGYWHIADSQTGYTAINRKALQTINWDKMYKRYGQPNDLLVKLNINDFSVVDVPVRPLYNIGEKSKLKIQSAIFSISWLILKLFFLRLKEKYVIRDFHPLIFFYFFGFVMILISSIFFFRTIVLWIAHKTVPELSLLISLFSFAIAFNSIAFAMWFDYEANRRLSQRIDLPDAHGPDDAQSPPR